MPDTLVESSARDAAPPSTTSLIHARGLTKTFGDLVAVDAIDFDVAPGESFGFLGPNGAGKTSTMRMIGCVSPMSGGTLRILGQDPERNRGRLRDLLVPVGEELRDPRLEFRGAVLAAHVPDLRKRDQALPDSPGSSTPASMSLWTSSAAYSGAKSGAVRSNSCAKLSITK